MSVQTIYCRINKLRPRTIKPDGWAIGEAEGEDGAPLVLRGHIASQPLHRWLRIEGRPQDHPKFGPQWQVINCEPVLPGSASAPPSALERNLIDLIPGVGKTTAQKIVAAGVENINANPELLYEYIASRHASAAVDSWRHHQREFKIRAHLRSAGLGAKRQQEILDQCGGIDEMVDQIETNPWALLDTLPQLGFALLDRIGLDQGLSPLTPARLHHGLTFYIEQLSFQTGDTIHPISMFLAHAATKLSTPTQEISPEILSEALQGARGIESPQPGYIGPSKIVFAERTISELFHQYRGIPGLNLPERLLSEITKEWELTPAQSDAVLLLSRHALSNLTGLAGTGKTTVLAAFVTAARRNGHFLALQAPTGAAMRRLGATAKTDATTIHRFLGRIDQRGFPASLDMLVVDEASMLSSSLAGRLLRALEENPLPIVFSGDPGQLPPIEAGCPFADSIACGWIPTARLSEIKRTGMGSWIPQVAAEIHQGHNPAHCNDIGPEQIGWRYIECSNPDQVEHEALVESIRQASTFAGDTAVLALNKLGSAGVHSLNLRLQQYLNPNPPDRLAPSSKNHIAWSVNDPVIFTSNDYSYDPPLTLAMRGTIASIHRSESNPVLSIFWEDDVERDHIVRFDGTIDSLILGYSATFHRSQGAEYSGVVVTLNRRNLGGFQETANDQTEPSKPRHGLASREAIYTAITRAKQEVVLVAEKGVLEQALLHRAVQRTTSLKFLLAN